MTTDASTLVAHANRPGLTSRLVGLGSVFGKSVRDARRATIVVAVLSGLGMVVGSVALASQFPTAEARLELARESQVLPAAFRGLLGEPIAIDTLGGFLSWRYGNFIPIMLGIWSILALSGTIAGEAGKGSLDLLVASPIGRARIALDKAAGHVVSLAAAMIVVALVTWIASVAFGTLQGDAISPLASLGHMLLLGLLSLSGGAAAFAVAPFLGRARSAGVGAIVLFGGYLVNGYADMAPTLGVLRPLSFFAWTANHRPLAGRYDWPGVILLALVCAFLLAIGVWAFVRRDLGRTAALRGLSLPALPVGTGGPFRRQLGDRLPAALAWGVGIGLYGWMIAVSSQAFAESLTQVPNIEEMIAAIYPGIDIRSAGGILQLAFYSFGSLLTGLAGATLVAGWASEEGERRLDLVLSTPLARARWALRSSVGVLVALGITMAVVAVLVAIGSAMQGSDAVTPVIGIGVLGLYGAAYAGIGLAVGGLVRPGLAAPVTAGLVIGAYLFELVGGILKLPDWLLGLSLNHHVGQPMVGTFDAAGIVAAALLTIGGVVVAAWGIRRRDLRN